MINEPRWGARGWICSKGLANTKKWGRVMYDEKNIKYMGNQIGRQDALTFVDGVLKEKGRLNDRMVFVDGLVGLTAGFLVYIIDDDDSFDVKLEPIDKKQQVVEFVIHKDTRTLYQSMGDQGPANPDDENMDFLDDMS